LPPLYIALLARDWCDGTLQPACLFLIRIHPVDDVTGPLNGKEPLNSPSASSILLCLFDSYGCCHTDLLAAILLREGKDERIPLPLGLFVLPRHRV
uniref:Secreted protein n=1 Tax=Haemonchus placei TaxID=6290 RepID=A0A0N4XBJ3_HAEPC